MGASILARGAPDSPGRGLRGLTRARVKKPLVAAVEGWAIGGRVPSLPLACDLIVAAKDARFGFPEVTRGLVASEGEASWELPRRLPYHIAVRILLTGEPLPANEAAQHGLVNELTEPGQALEAAYRLARRVAQNAPLALAAVKDVLRETQALDDDDAFRRQDQLIEHVTNSEDAREGAAAFAEKRAPEWRGR